MNTTHTDLLGHLGVKSLDELDANPGECPCAYHRLLRSARILPYGVMHSHNDSAGYYETQREITGTPGYASGAPEAMGAKMAEIELRALKDARDEPHNPEADYDGKIVPYFDNAHFTVAMTEGEANDIFNAYQRSIEPVKDKLAHEAKVTELKTKIQQQRSDVYHHREALDRMRADLNADGITRREAAIQALQDAITRDTEILNTLVAKSKKGTTP